MYRYKYMYTHTDTPLDTVTEPCNTSQTNDGAAAQAQLSEVTSPPCAAMKMLTVQALTPFQNTSASVTPLPASLAGLKAWQFFWQQMAHGNPPLPSGGNMRMEEAKPLMTWFGSYGHNSGKRHSPAPQVSGLRRSRGTHNQGGPPRLGGHAEVHIATIGCARARQADTVLL